MKQVPHCTFSDFEGRQAGMIYKSPQTINKEFSSIPNYRLASKAFDAQHLDRFITRLSQSERE